MDDSKSSKSGRRKFIKNATVIGAGLTLGSCVSFDGPKNTSDMPTTAPHPRLPTQSTGSSNEFDFIIVGAGAGGAPLAARLARAKFRVLLLDAGGDYVENNIANPNVETPAFHPLATEDEKISWDFFVKHYADPSRLEKDSKYTEKCRKKGGIFYPRAATLGGCASHNAMVTMYPDNADWEFIQQIARTDGHDASSWSPDQMRTYFQRLENHLYADAGKSRFGTDTDGWLSTERPSPWLLAKDAGFRNVFLAALKESGIAGVSINPNTTNDPNHWNYVKNKFDMMAIVPKATRFGKRSGPRDFLMQTKNDPRFGSYLTIRPYCHVTRVLIESQSSGKRATGVEFIPSQKGLYEASPLQKNTDLESVWAQFENHVERASAKLEVILSGGAFNSPQLLMLSGIGDEKVKNHFERAKKEFHVLRPGVGKNLQDKYEFGIVSQHKEFKLLKGCEFKTTDKPYQQYRHFYKNADGAPDSGFATHPYSTNGVVAGILKKSANSKAIDPSQDPDLYIFATPSEFRGYYPGYSKDVYTPGRLSWAILKRNSNNAGEVKLRDENGVDPLNPLRTPDICFNYFPELGANTETGRKSEADLNSIIEGVEIVRKVNARLNDSSELNPGLHVKGEELREKIINEIWGHHASCSNKMGSHKDPMAVVDSNFSVIGIQGLRVVDASAFPKMIGLFVALPIYMMSEKAAELLTRTYQDSPLRTRV